jgi:hypothetical protein
MYKLLKYYMRLEFGSFALLTIIYLVKELTTLL